MKNSLDRIYQPEPGVASEPEVSSDQDVIAKILSKATQGDPNTIPEPANDTERLEMVRESLRAHSMEVPGLSVEEQEEVDEKVEDGSLLETAAKSQERNRPEDNKEDAARPADTVDGEGSKDGETPEKPPHKPSSTGHHGEEKKKNPLFRIFTLFGILGAALTWVVTTSVRKITEGMMKMGLIDGGKGAKKPAATGGSHGGGATH